MLADSQTRKLTSKQAHNSSSWQNVYKAATIASKNNFHPPFQLNTQTHSLIQLLILSLFTMQTSFLVAALFSAVAVNAANDAISQITDGQIQAPAKTESATKTETTAPATTKAETTAPTVKVQTANGANKNALGCGAIAAIAAGLLM
ncbi:hypothetical protein TBLA_0I01125 [Henningerozyma blattae CBS 6284]|uniref:Uncharacterized protein n=1 Tax=Henningerozyma blattae (strain ATCC 34711 / CBS 6284 / DSM 70876 / NBRC 10599 / NRRL Y-10934 / UCD 77-7) TaxID=1071380 RepID=I2H8S0_HENB6|nr:hypothetical protein TBLA_0I01125 [Tetrapisispora blattae CBS 6284]CCH62772.1 hypothetical protein TBLA_0I01125 [Tetrapisispora blattae CBS 6284]